MSWLINYLTLKSTREKGTKPPPPKKKKNHVQRDRERDEEFHTQRENTDLKFGNAYNSKFTYQVFLNVLNATASELNIILLASDGDHIRVSVLTRQVNARVGLVADLTNVGSTLADDVLVEVLEDADLGLVVTFQLEANKIGTLDYMYIFARRLKNQNINNQKR